MVSDEFYSDMTLLALCHYCFRLMAALPGEQQSASFFPSTCSRRETRNWWLCESE